MVLPQVQTMAWSATLRPRTHLGPGPGPGQAVELVRVHAARRPARSAPGHVPLIPAPVGPRSEAPSAQPERDPQGRAVHAWVTE